MKLPKYQLKSDDELFSYQFISEGPKGFITKSIQFTLINTGEIYNLAFGDKNSVSGDIDDSVISNNGDSEKVLATVIGAVYAFYDKHPNAWIYAVGSTSSRTRLYRMGITKYFDEMEADFELYGECNGEWEFFEKGKTFTAFLVKFRSSKFEV